MIIVAQAFSPTACHGKPRMVGHTSDDRILVRNTQHIENRYTWDPAAEMWKRHAM